MTLVFVLGGSLRVNENGLLQTTSGQNLVGEGGPIAVPPDTNITIASDGTVSTVSTEFQPGPSNVLGRLKLVNPPTAGLLRGDDGLFRQADGTPAQNDPAVRIVDGVIEGSNVNPVDSMVNMISLARQFETQVKMMKAAEDLSSAGNSMIRA